MELMSSSHIEKEKLIPLYYSRQYVEKAFSYSKDDLSLLPLRVHREESLMGIPVHHLSVAYRIYGDPETPGIR